MYLVEQRPKGKWLLPILPLAFNQHILTEEMVRSLVSYSLTCEQPSVLIDYTSVTEYL